MLLALLLPGCARLLRNGGLAGLPGYGDDLGYAHHLDQLEAIDHDLVTGLQATDHHPVGALGATDLHRNLFAGGCRYLLFLAGFRVRHFDRASRLDEGDHVALGGAGDGLLRNQHGFGNLRLIEQGPHIHARQQRAVGVGHLGAQRDLAGAFVDGQVGEEQRALLAVFASVVELDAYGGAFTPFGMLELATFQTGLQAHDGRGGLGDVDVDRVDLLHGGQRRGGPLADQRALGDQRPADAAADRRGDGGVGQVDLGRPEGGTGHADVGRCLLLGGHGIVIVLPADGVGLDQRGVAGDLLGGQLLGRDGPVQRGLGTVDGSFQRGRIDLEQLLAGLHVRAFLEQPFFQDAGGAGANFGHARGFDTAGQVFGDAHRGEGHLQYAHRQGGRYLAGGAGLLLPAALVAGGDGGQRDADHKGFDGMARRAGHALLAVILPRVRGLFHGKTGSANEEAGGGSVNDR